MFTGLVQTMGVVSSMQQEGAGQRLAVSEPAIARTLEIGESIAVNGACLTAVAIDSDRFFFQVGPETLSKTNLGQARTGDHVNLERSLRVGDPLGGHWVQGHIDGLGRLASRERQGDWDLVCFECPPSLTAGMVPKGSVAVDGVSLTVVDVQSGRFSVALIPHTLSATTLGFKNVGDTVNLETDILGKYVAKYMESQMLTRSNPPG